MKFGIFEPFKQAASTRRREFGGTGLGLVLSIRLAVTLKGDIYIQDCVRSQGGTLVIAFQATLPNIAPSSIRKRLAMTTFPSL